MLELLTIQNFATVARLEVEFGVGLNALTGETGAGKSLIMGALQALLGERTEKGVIRSGEKSAEVGAVINLRALDEERLTALRGFLDGWGVAFDDSQLVLRRVITPSSTRAYVNGSVLTLQQMRELGEMLVEVHGPNDQQLLFHSRTQLALVDAFGKLEKELESCAAAWAAFCESRRELDEFENSTVSEAELEMLRYQLREIDDAGLSAEDELQMVERHKLAANAQELLRLASESSGELAENDGSILERLQFVLARVEELSEFTPETGGPLVDQLETVVSLLQDVNAELQSLGASLDIEPGELESIEQRLSVIHRLKRKYNRDIPGLLEYADEIRERLAGRDDFENTLKKMRGKCEDRKRELGQACRCLSERRREVGVRLAAHVEAKLKNLGFAQSTFAIQTTEIEPGARGADRVDFLFAPNPGEEPQPLRKIASSGEMARVMLAIKTVLGAVDHTPILVFDEIDANVGGRTAAKVAGELAEVAKRHQVFCITHLPQVAAAATTHLRVDKIIVDGRTMTNIEQLNAATRAVEISRMMGADPESETARLHAESMLEQVK